jgi:hypothetical protein
MSSRDVHATVLHLRLDNEAQTRYWVVQFNNVDPAWSSVTCAYSEAIYDESVAFRIASAFNAGIREVG